MSVNHTCRRKTLRPPLNKKLFPVYRPGGSKGPYPLGNRWYNRRYNRPTTADCTADCTTDCLVGMAYLLGDWATDRPATGYRRLISSMFDISPPTRRPATAVARRRVGAVVNRLVGMGLKRANWNFSFHLFKKNFFFTFPPVHSCLKEIEIRKKKKKILTSRLAVFSPTRPTGNHFLLKGGLRRLRAQCYRLSISSVTT